MVMIEIGEKKTSALPGYLRLASTVSYCSDTIEVLTFWRAGDLTL